MWSSPLIGALVLCAVLLPSCSAASKNNQLDDDDDKAPVVTAVFKDRRIFGVGLMGSGTLALRDAFKAIQIKKRTIVFEDNSFAPFMYEDGYVNMAGAFEDVNQSF